MLLSSISVVGKFSLNMFLPLNILSGIPDIVFKVQFQFFAHMHSMAKHAPLRFDNFKLTLPNGCRYTSRRKRRGGFLSTALCISHILMRNFAIKFFMNTRFTMLRYSYPVKAAEHHVGTYIFSQTEVLILLTFCGFLFASSHLPLPLSYVQKH